MASQTNIPAGDPLARKLYSVAVFAESRRKHSFTNSMTAPAPKMSKADKKMRGQTSPDYPIVLVTDLQKTAGDTVSVDLFHNLSELPIMGDQRVTGKAEGMTKSSMDVSIDFGRKPVDTGGRMARKRTVHDLRLVGKSNLVDWYRRYEDQCTLVHLAGSRGSHNDADWILPLDSDPDFSDYLINPVVAPTYDRHFYANDATALSNLDTSDFLSLDDIDRLRVAIDESPFPLQPIRLPDDPAGEEEPLYCLMVTPRQWHHLQTQTGSESWRTFLSNAWQRASGWNHPLFKGTPGMWNGILVKKMYRPIRFNAGDSVTVAQDADAFSTTTVSAAVETERALLLGGQALGNVFGSTGMGSNYMFDWHEEEVDKGDRLEITAKWMGGKSKLRFEGSDGRVNDHGVMVIDSYAPAP